MTDVPSFSTRTAVTSSIMDAEGEIQTFFEFRKVQVIMKCLSDQLRIVCMSGYMDLD